MKDRLEVMVKEYVAGVLLDMNVPVVPEGLAQKVFAAIDDKNYAQIPDDIVVDVVKADVQKVINENVVTIENDGISTAKPDPSGIIIKELT